jgi:lactoylglutathione lyase
MTTLAYTIVFVSDMTRSVAFYRDIIGLPLKHQSPGWSEFATEGCRLALRKSEPRSALPGQIDDITAGHCHPGFFVQDIDAFATKMNQARVAVTQPVKLQDFGARMGIWRDPDGLPLSVFEAR